jgi:hypothetical protein
LADTTRPPLPTALPRRRIYRGGGGDDMNSTLLIAAMFAATAASAQSSLTLPNNSAGTELDTPPVVPGTPSVLEPSPRDGIVTREEAEQLAGPKAAEDADKNDDGRLDDKELRRLEDQPAPVK